MSNAIRKRIVAFIILLIFTISSFVYSNIDLFNSEPLKGENKDLLANSKTQLLSNNLKTNTTASEDTASKLSTEGYEESRVKSAEVFIERLQLQLKEITNDIYLINTNLFISGEDDTNDLVTYKTLIDSIDFKKALYYLVKLKDEFKSFEAVMDEYLLSLQIGDRAFLC